MALQVGKNLTYMAFLSLAVKYDFATDWLMNISSVQFHEEWSRTIFAR